MRKSIIAFLGAGAAVLTAAATTLPAEARPLGGGWNVRSVGWSPVRLSGPRGRSGGVLAASASGPSGRYLSDDAWFLSDIGGYLAEDQPYPEFLHGGYGGYGYGHGYDYPAYPARVSYGHRRSYHAVRVHGSAQSRRVVAVHRGTGSGPIRRQGR